MRSSPGWAPLFRFGYTSDFLGYITVHDRLLSYDLGDDGYFVGGHVNQVGTRKDILSNQAFTNAVISAAKRAIETVNILDRLRELGLFDPNNPNSYNRYLPTKLAREARSDACIRYALEAVGCTLSGADVVLPTLCSAAGFYIAVEW